MTAKQANSIIANKLVELGVSYTKLTARTISFSDLARTSCVFVKIHGWKPNPVIQELKELAVSHGFRVETDW